MPVRNDAPSVNVMARILSVMIEVPCELIVVYDDPDDTAVPVLDSLMPSLGNLRGLLNRRGRGAFNAVAAGVEAAHGRYVMLYAADEIGPVLAIATMLRLMEQGCEFISATRYRAGGRRYGGSAIGHILSYTANKMFGLLSCSALSDCTTGIKMFRRELFDKFELSDAGSGWSFAFEMAVQAQLMSLKLGEVSIVSIDRLFGGTSTFVLGAWLMSYLRWFLYGVRKLPPWRRPRPTLAFPVQNYISS
jgi:dolichol-phosphate mannosyltransferase